MTTIINTMMIMVLKKRWQTRPPCRSSKHDEQNTHIDHDTNQERITMIMMMMIMVMMIMVMMIMMTRREWQTRLSHRSSPSSQAFPCPSISSTSRLMMMMMIMLGIIIKIMINDNIARQVLVSILAATLWVPYLGSSSLLLITFCALPISRLPCHCGDFFEI